MEICATEKMITLLIIPFNYLRKLNNVNLRDIIEESVSLSVILESRSVSPVCCFKGGLHYSELTRHCSSTMDN